VDGAVGFVDGEQVGGVDQVDGLAPHVAGEPEHSTLPVHPPVGPDLATGQDGLVGFGWQAEGLLAVEGLEGDRVWGGFGLGRGVPGHRRGDPEAESLVLSALVVVLAVLIQCLVQLIKILDRVSVQPGLDRLMSSFDLALGLGMSDPAGDRSDALGG